MLNSKSNRILLGTLAFALSLFFFPKIGLAQNASANPWPELEKARKQITELWLYRQAVEEDSYSFTKNLCYIFEFRRRHGLDLEFPNPALEDLYVSASILSNTELQDSYMAWNVLTANGIKAAFDFTLTGNFYVLASSQLAQNLPQTQGYRRAVEESSRRVGVDLRHILPRQIKINQGIASGATLLGGGGAVAFAGKLVVKKLLVSALGRSLLAAGASPYVRWPLLALTIGGSASLAFEIWGYIHDQSTLTSSLQKGQLPDDGMSESDPWEQRRFRLFNFVIKVREAQKSEDPAQLLTSLRTGTLAPDFKEWQSSVPDLKEKALELEGELSQIPELHEKINKILNQRQSGEKIEDTDQILLQKAQFVGSLHLVIGLATKVGAQK